VISPCFAFRFFSFTFFAGAKPPPFSRKTFSLSLCFLQSFPLSERGISFFLLSVEWLPFARHSLVEGLFSILHFPPPSLQPFFPPQFGAGPSSPFLLATTFRTSSGALTPFLFLRAQTTFLLTPGLTFPMEDSFFPFFCLSKRHFWRGLVERTPFHLPPCRFLFPFRRVFLTWANSFFRGHSFLSRFFSTGRPLCFFGPFSNDGHVSFFFFLSRPPFFQVPSPFL